MVRSVGNALRDGARTVNLEVNDSGAWRRVTSFEYADFEDGDLEYAASMLLDLTAYPQLRARIIEQGSTAPIATWSLRDGWREWRA